MTVVASLEIALTCLLADELFAIYYVFIAIYAAYVFGDRGRSWPTSASPVS